MKQKVLRFGLVAAALTSLIGTASAYYAPANYEGVVAANQGLIPSIYVNNEQDYRALNGDLVNLDDNTLVSHWAFYGINEARIGSSVFDVAYYRQQNGDLPASLSNAQLANQFAQYGINENRTSSRVFNAGAYARYNNRDLGTLSSLALYDHYVRYGINEGRRASDDFDPASYRRRYSDLAALSNYALVMHYLSNGIREGRSGAPTGGGEQF